MTEPHDEPRDESTEAAAQERALLIQVLAAQDAERREVADAVHDDTLQALLGAELQLEMFQRRLAAEGHDELSDRAGRVRRDVQDAVDRLRGMLFVLAPVDLDDGLGAALRDLAAAVLTPAGIPYQVSDATEAQPPELPARTLHRVAREALVNVVRHAGARAVEVALHDDETGWTLTVADDGTGPGPDGFAERPGHRGLASMRLRVEAAGGILDLWSADNGGTRVTAWVPVRSRVLVGAQPVLDVREPLREVLDESAEAFVAFDRDWRYVFLNRPAAQLAGRAARDLEGTNIWAEFPHLLGSPFHVQALRAMARQRPVEYTQFDDGRWLETRLVPSPSGLFAYVRDVTARRQGRAASPGPLNEDAGGLVLRALVGAAEGSDPRARVQSVLGAMVDSRWFASARLVAPGGRVLAAAGVRGAGDGSAPGLDLLDEPLPTADGLVLEVEGGFPAHRAVRWATRTLAAALAPDAVRLARPAD
jgi:PAS domain S-box-containing protein